MFKENNILYFKDLMWYVDRDDLLSLTCMKNLAPISLTKSLVRMILDVIDYYNFMYFYGDRALARDPTQWDRKDFDSYIWK